MKNTLFFINKTMGEKSSVFSFRSSNMLIGNYETNPEWVHFGKKYLSVSIKYPGYEESESLDIKYSNIKALKRILYLLF